MIQPANLCSRCGKRLGPQAVRAAGKQYHPQCFSCDHCRKPLSGQFFPRGERLFHPECHDKLFVPRCEQCREPITGSYTKDPHGGRFHTACYTERYALYCSLCNEVLQGSYLYDHWGQKAHPAHNGVETRQCHVCARLMAPAHGGKLLSDGRGLCQGCCATEVQSFTQIQQAKREVLERMHSVGFAYIPDYIKVELSEDQQLLNARLKASPTGNIHGFTRTAQRHIPTYGLILEHSIHVLSGLPKIAFMGVLAHELLHVWIHEQGLHHLSHAEVEGFCNLGTALMLQSEDSDLARVLLQRMAEDPDPAYGDGYRAMAWRLTQLGWPALLKALTTPPLLSAPPEVMRPQERTPLAPPTAKPQVPSAPSASDRAAERLAALKQKLQTPNAPATTPPPTAAKERPATSPEVEAKVKALFQKKPPPKPPSGGSKLGKFKR